MDKKKTGSLIKAARMKKNRKLFGYILVFLTLLCCITAAYAGLGSSTMQFTSNSEVIYVILMTLTIILSICGCSSQDEGIFLSEKKYSKHLCSISIISLVWCVLVTWVFALLIPNGIIPFGMEKSSVGVFINGQLIAISIINIGILAVELYRNCKNANGIHWGNMVAISAIYYPVFYVDMSHRLITVDEMYQFLSIGTIIVISELMVSLLLVNYLERRKFSKVSCRK